MSRIGKQPITVPAGVEFVVVGAQCTAKGPKGSLVLALHPHVSVTREGDELRVTVQNPEDGRDRALWGLFGRLVHNLVEGVTKGYTKQLELNGVGFKVANSPKGLAMSLGFSHPVEYVLPAGIQATVEKNLITISGIDKQLVGETAACIRRLKKPEPYKGKGIKYVDEVIRRKAGKAAKAGK